MSDTPTAENRDLRDAIRLIIGRAIDVPWHQVAEREVEGYLAAIRELKAKAAPAATPTAGERPTATGTAPPAAVDAGQKPAP